MNYTKYILPYRLRNSILALGGQGKGSFCLAKGNAAYASDDYGDLSELNNFNSYKNGIRMLETRLKITPDIIACDNHPEYISTKYAKELIGKNQRFSKIVYVQHHEAHIASCAADNGIQGRVIGVAFDGTGFGNDNNIWGGEFFTGSLKALKRRAHLKYIPMPSGEACVREPWRMGLSYLYAIYKSGIKKQGQEKAALLMQMIDKNINSPLTSSMGRLFDAVSAIIGACSYAKYEGEAAVKLEQLIGTGKGAYKFDIKTEEGMFIAGPDFLIRSIVADLKKEVPLGLISLKFHNAVCNMIKEVCILLRRDSGINKVCLSGGVFQNKYLSRNTKIILEKEGFRAYLHKNVPAGDLGITIGQAVIAANLIK